MAAKPNDPMVAQDGVALAQAIINGLRDVVKEPCISICDVLTLSQQRAG